MRILITGAGGMLGRDVHALAQAAGHDVCGLARADLDITDFEAVGLRVAAEAPDVVINCAAYTRVDDAETDVAGAQLINADAPGVLAGAAAQVGAFTVHVSTDYVFDGTKTSGPYRESDAIGPRSVYGQTKLEGERAVAAAAPDAHAIVRSSWLFGNGGGCFPQTILGLAASRPELKVVDDQVGSPTFTPHLAAALLEIAAGRSPQGVIHVAASGECSWFDFAAALVESSGLDCQVAPCSTAEFPRPAPRPAYSVLRSERGEVSPLPDWQEGMAEYLSARPEARV